MNPIDVHYHGWVVVLSFIIAAAASWSWKSPNPSQMDVVAEGVGTPEQVAFLQSVGCKLMQGYYFAKPMPAEEIGRRLRPDVSE